MVTSTRRRISSLSTSIEKVRCVNLINYSRLMIMSRSCLGILSSSRGRSHSMRGRTIRQITFRGIPMLTLLITRKPNRIKLSRYLHDQLFKITPTAATVRMICTLRSQKSNNHLSVCNPNDLSRQSRKNHK